MPQSWLDSTRVAATLREPDALPEPVATADGRSYANCATQSLRRSRILYIANA
jgi:hypothetical protein